MNISTKTKLESINISLNEKEAYNLLHLIMFAFDFNDSTSCLYKSEEELGKNLIDKLQPFFYNSFKDMSSEQSSDYYRHVNNKEEYEAIPEDMINIPNFLEEVKLSDDTSIFYDKTNNEYYEMKDGKKKILNQCEFDYMKRVHQTFNNQNRDVKKAINISKLKNIILENKQDLDNLFEKKNLSVPILKESDNLNEYNNQMSYYNQPTLNIIEYLSAKRYIFNDELSNNILEYISQKADEKYLNPDLIVNDLTDREIRSIFCSRYNNKLYQCADWLQSIDTDRCPLLLSNVGFTNKDLSDSDKSLDSSYFDNSLKEEWKKICPLSYRTDKKIKEYCDKHKDTNNTFFDINLILNKKVYIYYIENLVNKYFEEKQDEEEER